MSDPENMRYRCTERYVYGWTDWRAVYGSPVKRAWWKFKVNMEKFWAVYGHIVGTFIITAPIAVAAWYFWKWMGWL